MPRGRIIDLTHSSSPPPPRKKLCTSQVQKKASTSRPQRHLVSRAVEQAVDTLNEQKLRSLIKCVLPHCPKLIAVIEEAYLCKGKDIIRYHEDTESEDRGESEEEEDDEDSGSEVESEDSDMKAERRRLRKFICVGNEESTPKEVRCENCREEFWLNANDRSDCEWHPGEKELNYDDDFWADHDWQCHGEPSSFIDEPDYAEGFIWSCCQESGDNAGCKSTRHKAKQNVIHMRPPTPSPAPVVAAVPKKRKAGPMLEMVRCENCHGRFDVYDNSGNSCRHHPGYKQVSDDAEHWCDWDDDCHGGPGIFVDDLDHADGFAWSCCRELSHEPGCETGPHVPVGADGAKRRKGPVAHRVFLG